MMAVFGLKIPFLFAIINPSPPEGIRSILPYHIHQAHLLNPKFINDSQAIK
jgi:hypothetical protein